ncbi:MAG: DUF2059 domain-containing protein [Pseudomonadota bacterium]
MVQRVLTLTLTLALPLAIWIAASLPARANDARAVFEAMQLGEILGIMREEGLAYGDELQTEMFPGSGGAGWPRVVQRIYAPERMEREFFEPFAAELEGQDIQPLLDFFGSERGQEIVKFEIGARRALLDETVEEMAQQIWSDLKGELDPRHVLIERFVESNDLIEENVAGAMNASLAFYEGLSTGEEFESVWTMDRILAEVWDQESIIRADTKDWIFPYLSLAFEPLRDSDIEAYISLSETDAGRALNAALFGAFDVLFVNISRDMGAAAAVYMQGEDI